LLCKTVFMVLNYIWIGFFILAFIVALIKLIFTGNYNIFPELVDATFSMAKTGFEVSLGLTGVLTLWMGLMRVGEKGGIVTILARLAGPFFNRLFPDLPKNHPAFGSIMLNFSANMLGLDNAATPLGLKAMDEMQAENPVKDTASNPQIMFLVLNASGLTILPISIMVYREQMGAADPSDVFIPILLATFASTMAGLIAVSIYQKINLLNKVMLAYLGGLFALIGAGVWYFSTLTKEELTIASKVASNVILFSIIIAFILLAMRKKVNVYEAFIEGAKDGFGIAIKIIPYLIAILVAIGVFRASGAMAYMVNAIGWLVAQTGLNTDFIPALPTALMKPLSGSGSRGMMIDAMKTFGADSFVGRLTCIMQGAADTTFYIIAVYFGAVGVKKTRHAIPAGLIAEAAGMIAAILVAYMFFA